MEIVGKTEKVSSSVLGASVLIGKSIVLNTCDIDIKEKEKKEIEEEKEKKEEIEKEEKGKKGKRKRIKSTQDKLELLQRKTAKKLEKKVSKLRLKQELYRLKNIKDYPLLIGIDYSYKSPGLSIKNNVTGEIFVYFVPQRKREVNWNQEIKPKFHIIALPWIDVTSYNCREARFEYLAQLFLNTITQKQLAGNFTNKQVCVAIEGYSLRQNEGASSSSSVSSLFEAGGIMRNKIYVQGFKMVEISPMSVKQVFSGSGHAKKTDMLQTWTQTFHLPNLLELFSLKENTLDLKPCEDICDAFALLHCLADQNA